MNRAYCQARQGYRESGVKVVLLGDPDYIARISRFIRERPDLWNEGVPET